MLIIVLVVIGMPSYIRHSQSDTRLWTRCLTSCTSLPRSDTATDMTTHQITSQKCDIQSLATEMTRDLTQPQMMTSDDQS